MNARKRPMRYAHSDGHTDVCYSDDGKYILTCGIDGDVRIWAGLEDDDPSSQCVGEQALTVVHKNKHYYVGSDNNSVQAYTFPESDRDGIISRFTAAVTHIAVSNDGKRIVAGSSDMEIHVNTIGASKTTVLTGHKAPILGVALDPKDKYVASSSCDGTVRVWTINDTNTVVSWNCVPVCNAFVAAKCLGRPSWQPNTGRYLAVPHGREIRIYERETWNRILSLCHDEVKQAPLCPSGAHDDSAGYHIGWMSVRTDGCNMLQPSVWTLIHPAYT